VKNICAIMQPTFMPWAGYFDLIDAVDVMVFLDDVQLTRRSWHTRNRIKTSQGELFLTLPIVKDKHRDDQLICDARVQAAGFKSKFLATIEQSYRKATFFNEVMPLVRSLIEAPIEVLSRFNANIIQVVAERIGLSCQFCFSSELGPIDGQKDEKLANICRVLDIPAYLSARGSADYIEAEQVGGAFRRMGIDLWYQNYAPVEYPQLYGSFIPYMGIFDLLFNVGLATARATINTGRSPAVVPEELVMSGRSRSRDIALTEELG